MGDSLTDMLMGNDGPVDWTDGQISPDLLRWQLMIQAERARQAREADQGLSIYSAFPQITPEAQLHLGGQYGDAKPSLPPVEGLRLPEARAAKDPVGNGVSLADWLQFQGWAPGRTAPKPGEPYMGPLPPTPATMSADLRTRAAPRPQDRPRPRPEAERKPAKKPAKRQKEPRAKPRPAAQIARSESGKHFVVGKVYRNKQGQRFRFQPDGSFKKV